MYPIASCLPKSLTLSHIDCLIFGGLHHGNVQRLTQTAHCSVKHEIARDALLVQCGLCFSQKP